MTNNAKNGRGCLVFSALWFLAIILVFVVLPVCFAALGTWILIDAGGPGVAVLDVKSGLYDSTDVLAQLDDLMANSDAKALVVRVECQGGAIVACEEVYNALKRVGDDGIPVVASIGSVACSGGYYVSLGADFVFANRSSLVGNIASVGKCTDANALMRISGVMPEKMKENDLPAVDTLFIKDSPGYVSPESAAVLDDLNAHLVDVVVAERALKRADVVSIAEGTMFNGEAAVDAGLVDSIGDLHDAIMYAARLAEIEKEPTIIRYERTPAMLRYFLRFFM